MTNKYENMLAKEPSHKIEYLVTAVILVVLLGWSTSALSSADMTSEGLRIGSEILQGIWHPDTKILFSTTENGVGYLLLETIAIAVLGTIIGAVIAVPLSFLASKNIVPRPLAAATRIFLVAIRTVPSLVYGLMFIRIVGPGPTAGVLTLAISSIGMVSKLCIETIEDVKPQLFESLDAVGSTFLQRIRYGVLPQLRADFVSILVYRFDMNLRNATILGLVGAGGIGAPLIFSMMSYKWQQAGAIMIGLFVLIVIVEWLSGKIRHADIGSNK